MRDYNAEEDTPELIEMINNAKQRVQSKGKF